MTSPVFPSSPALGRPPWYLGRTARHLIYGISIGAAAGTPILGVGGRIVMRIIALKSNAPGAFSIGGTMTVVLLGAVSGIGGGLIAAVIHRFVPGPALIRTLLLMLACGLLTLRGLHPVTPLPLALFMPLVVAYVAVMDVAWRRRQPARNDVTAPQEVVAQ